LPNDTFFISITTVKISPFVLPSPVRIAEDNVSFFTHTAVLFSLFGRAARHSARYSFMSWHPNDSNIVGTQLFSTIYSFKSFALILLTALLFKNQLVQM